MNYHTFQKIGDYHRTAHAPCQDAFLIAEDDRYTLAAVADGVSDCTHGKRGAELAVRALWELAQSERELLFSYPPQLLAYLVTDHICMALEEEAESDDLSAYSSTLIFAYTEKKTGRTILGNLGDGAIIGFIDDRHSVLLSPSRRSRIPYVTTSPQAHIHLDLQYRTLYWGDRILLATDGIIHAAFRSEQNTEQLKTAIECFDFAELDCLLSEASEPDDCTYIAAERKATEIIKRRT